MRLGRGAYGTVYEHRDRVTGNYVAIKYFNEDYDDNGISFTGLREISILRSMCHPGIVRVRDAWYHRHKNEEFELCMVMDKGIKDLAQYTVRSEHIPIVIRQLLEAVTYCHDRGIVHRDLKPDNIIVMSINDDDIPMIQIADFGCGRVVCADADPLTHHIVTLWYRPLEILLGGTDGMYSFAVDIWSLGCIAARLVHGEALFRGDCEFGQIIEIIRVLGTPSEEIWHDIRAYPDFKCTFPMFPRRIDNKSEYFTHYDRPYWIDFILACLEYRPQDRPHACELLQHAYLQGIPYLHPNIS